MKPQRIFSSNYDKQSYEGAFNMKFMQGYFQKKVDSLLSVGATELQ